MATHPSAPRPPPTLARSQESLDSGATGCGPKQSSSRAAWLVIFSVLGFACLGLGALAWAAHFIQSAGPETLLSRHLSPNGQWILSVRHAGPAFAPRGPSTVGLYASTRATPDETSLATFYVNNDGASLSPESCQVKWLHPAAAVAQVTCHGEEQTDDVWLVNLSAGQAWQLSGD